MGLQEHPKERAAEVADLSLARRRNKQGMDTNVASFWGHCIDLYTLFRVALHQ